MASEIKVDTISEKTSANGVTIDGVSLKDSKIATANSVDSDAYVDGSIDAVHLSANSVDSDAYVDGSIDTAHIDALQVTGAKLNTDVISAQTELAAEPADADEFMVSDGGVLKRIDYSLIKAANSPSFSAYRNTTQAISSAANTVVVYNQENYDTDSAYDTTTGRFTVPAGEGGKYFFTAGWLLSFLDDTKMCSIDFLKNGSAYNYPNHNHDVTSSQANQYINNQVQGILNLDAADYIEINIYQNNGTDLNIYNGQNHFGCCKLIGI